MRTQHNTDCTRQTVYNWIHKGVLGLKLKHARVGHKYLTTKEWVDEFLNHLQSVRPS